jgi:hypothetical protein
MPKTRAARDRKVVARTAVAREMRVLPAFAFGIELAPPFIPNDEALLDWWRILKVCRGGGDRLEGPEAARWSLPAPDPCRQDLRFGCMAIAWGLANSLGHRPRDRDPGSVTKIAPNRSRHVQVFVGAYIRVIDHRVVRALTQRLADQGMERHKPRHGWAGPNRSDPLMSHRSPACRPLCQRSGWRRAGAISALSLHEAPHLLVTLPIHGAGAAEAVAQGPHSSGLRRNSLWSCLKPHAMDSARNVRTRTRVRARARPIS